MNDPSLVHAGQPIRIGAPKTFGLVRDLLRRSQFDEATIASRLACDSLSDFKRHCDGRPTLGGPVEDANAALIRLFLDGEPVPAALLERLLTAESLEALVALGLVAPSPDDPSALDATVALYPVQGLWVISDRTPLPMDGRASPLPPQDFVFSAGTNLTRDFITTLPPMAGLRVLEQCAGTGIGALMAARDGATEAWAVDIGPRSVHFARFNAHLNQLADRVVAVVSDLWAALEGERFDMVVAHPPYVPANVHRHDFRDAGEDGEHVTRRLVAGLGAHLRPGGRCVIRAGLSDRRTGVIPARIRAWLGAEGDEFDLIVIDRGIYDTMEAYRSATHGGADFVDLERWMRFFAASGVEGLSVCAIELRRDAAGRAPITDRRKAGAAVDHRVFDWQFRWARFVADGGASPEARLATMRPRVMPGVRLAIHLESDSQDTTWQTVGAVVESVWPTHVIVKAPPLAPTLLELCDGTRDLGQLLGALRDAGLVDARVSRRDIALLIEPLAAAGALELPVCPLPSRPTNAPG